VGIKYFLSDAGRDLKKYEMTPSRRNLIGWFKADAITNAVDGEHVMEWLNTEGSASSFIAGIPFVWSRYDQPNCKLRLNFTANYVPLVDSSFYGQLHVTKGTVNASGNAAFPWTGASLEANGTHGNPKLDFEFLNEGDNFDGASLVVKSAGDVAYIRGNNDYIRIVQLGHDLAVSPYKDSWTITDSIGPFPTEANRMI
jgi:hypothetical protein